MQHLDDTRTTSSVGFMTAVEDELGTIFGGLLILNRFARPLEFHCTAPITPTRAQEILYGPTLKPFLYGELVGGALLRKVQARSIVVCVDQLPTLAAQHVTDLPVVLVLDDTPQQPAAAEGDAGPETTASRSNSFDPVWEPSWASLPDAARQPDATRRWGLPGQTADNMAARSPARCTATSVLPLLCFCAGGYRLAVHRDYPAMQTRAAERLAQLSEGMDLVEPFHRIREAIAEARRGV